MREEALAAFKYRVYAAKAATAGLQQVADIFNETADNEQEHGEQWMKLLSPFGDVPDTLDNLLDAVASEHAEWATQYAVYTDVARNEGYRKLADKFAAIGAIEAQHEARYNKLVDRLRSGTEFDNGRPTVWICRKCGHQDYAAAPDNVCPVCGHPQGYFERIAENY
jgi:rubrerythrin